MQFFNSIINSIIPNKLQVKQLVSVKCLKWQIYEKNYLTQWGQLCELQRVRSLKNEEEIDLQEWERN